MYRERDVQSKLDDLEARLSYLESRVLPPPGVIYPPKPKRFSQALPKLKNFLISDIALSGIVMLAFVIIFYILIFIIIPKMDAANTCLTICSNTNNSTKILSSIENDDLICTCAEKETGRIFLSTVEGYFK